MEDRADAFIALPGGIGTLEEVLEIITLRHIGYHRKPVVVLNRDGYYDPLLQMLQKAMDEGFARPSLAEAYHVSHSVEDALLHVETGIVAPIPAPEAPPTLEEAAEP